jgi:multicomponent Na+:H+ antiporter subunit E
VLHPAMPIRPGIVKVKTTLKSDMAKMLLANSITMTPGTISVDIIDDYLYIHWIYISSEDPEVYTSIITGAFEKYIKRIIE